MSPDAHDSRACAVCGNQVVTVFAEHPEGGRYILDVEGRCPVTDDYHTVEPSLADLREHYEDSQGGTP